MSNTINSDSRTFISKRVCVVALIGKSQHLASKTKAWKLNCLLEREFFKPHRSTKKVFEANRKKEVVELDDHSNIQTYFDEKQNVLYVDLESIFDTNSVMDLVLKKNNDLDGDEFFKLLEHEQIKHVKNVLLLFLVSHIIIVSNPTVEFDIGYIRFFRVIDTLRNKLLPSIIELFKSSNVSISKEWMYAGRPCSPRVLFAFENYSRDTLTDSDNRLAKLQHSLEDQIYNCLRKSYIITNISNNSLFAIPANQEFVYVHRQNKDYIDSHEFLLNNLNRDCQKSNQNSITTHDLTQSDSSLFQQFVFQHVQIAFHEGFNDNIGRTNVQPVFELPKLSVWYEVFDILCDAFFNTNTSTRLTSALKTKFTGNFDQIKPYIDIDSKFSLNRCKKVLPIALQTYQEGLPLHYTLKTHQLKLEKAIKVYSNQARGPLYKRYLEKLERDCVDYWKSGRQLCEAISLTGNQCIHEMHNTGNQTHDRILLKKHLEDHTFSLQSIPLKPHCSGVVTISASNCGLYQKERIDPFDLKQANYLFYADFTSLDPTQYAKFHTFNFPIFDGSIIEEEKVKSEEDMNEQDDDSMLELDNGLSQRNDQQIQQNQGGASTDLFSSSHTKPHQTPETSVLATVNDQLQSLKIDTFVDTSDFTTSISSKTHALPHMTHSDSQPGLIPLFSSWSLLSIGKSSSYIAQQGLNQPGFLQNHNFLVPWDIQVKASDRLDKKKLRSRESCTIRCYIGMEYECPCGHRFICSGPDRIVKQNSKDDASKVLNNDMPLYTACPCRSSGKDLAPYMAQLMRIFIVTPASSPSDLAPIQISIQPRVQPNPAPCPVFRPSYEAPIRLTDNSVWVLRLPYIYVNDNNVPYRPKDIETLQSCRLLKGMFSWSEK